MLLGISLVILCIFGYFCGPPVKNMWSPLLLCTFEYFLVLLGTLGYLWIILSIVLYFWVIFGSLTTFVVPQWKKTCGPPLLLRIFEYFLVLLGSLGYLWVILRIFLYFLVLLCTFLVILSIFGYFCGPPCEKNLWSPLLLCTFEYFLVLLGTLGHL